MSEPDPPSFHLRLPASLKAQLEASRGTNSLNREIVERLQRTFAADPALDMAAIERLMQGLRDDDRQQLIAMVAAAVRILAKPVPRRRRK